MSSKEDLKKAVGGLTANEEMFSVEEDPTPAVKKKPAKSAVKKESTKAVDATIKEGTEPEKIEALADSLKEEKVATPRERFKNALSKINLSEADAFDLIMDIANNGHFEKDYSIFKGAVKYTLRSSNLYDAADFLKHVEEEDLRSESRTSFVLGLYVLASVLHDYNGTLLSELDINERAEFIKKNVPPVFFKAIRIQASKFSEITEILGTDEAADFF